jgi:hypothetical protein
VADEADADARPDRGQAHADAGPAAGELGRAGLGQLGALLLHRGGQFGLLRRDVTVRPGNAREHRE